MNVDGLKMIRQVRDWEKTFTNFLLKVLNMEYVKNSKKKKRQVNKKDLNSSSSKDIQRAKHI